MTIGAFICGVEGLCLSVDEKQFLQEFKPWGLILFARNVDTADQIKALTDEFRNIVDRADAPVLIDQEGGRVQRMKAPNWRNYPAGCQYLKAFNGDVGQACIAASIVTRLLAQDLYEVGINVDCLPVLDVPVEGSHEIIGDRAYSSVPAQVSLIARSACEGLMAGGVLPVIKHIPGHGRAKADSHLSLPVVKATRSELEATDFAPFKDLSDMPMAMTAHVVYADIDAEAPATQSKTVIDAIIRDHIGFDGLIMSDDITMRALSGSIPDRVQKALAAGCDLMLHCDGHLGRMREVAENSGELTGEALARADKALSFLQTPTDFDVAEAEKILKTVLAA